jgi:hypothetical protein
MKRKTIVGMCVRSKVTVVSMGIVATYAPANRNVLMAIAP